MLERLYTSHSLSGTRTRCIFVFLAKRRENMSLEASLIICKGRIGGHLRGKQIGVRHTPGRNCYRHVAFLM